MNFADGMPTNSMFSAAVSYAFTSRAHDLVPVLEQGPMSTGLCGRPLCTRYTPTTPAVCPSSCTDHASAPEPIDLCLAEGVMSTQQLLTSSCERYLTSPARQGVHTASSSYRIVNLHLGCPLCDGCPVTLKFVVTTRRNRERYLAKRHTPHQAVWNWRTEARSSMTHNATGSLPRCSMLHGRSS